jgi:PRTRC genetic system ThiF family protein
MAIHYTHAYLLAPEHKVTIDLIGLGGTGSQVLTSLARMNEALMGLGHPGFHVRAWDNDLVSPSNMGRQLFSPSDLNQNKALVLISRVNRFFGYEWEARPELYKGKELSNIVITCIDTAAGRIQINDKIGRLKWSNRWQPFEKPIYWLDIGNMQKKGQCVLGTLQKVPQPSQNGDKRRYVLPNVIKMFPQIKRIKEEDQGPSCSLAQALQKQDLFINSTLAQFGCNLLWKLIREGMIRYQGCYVNLETLSVNPIKIK